MVKYKTSGWGNDIDKIEIIRETKHSVWIKGKRWGESCEQRCQKATRWDIYHNSWATAHAHLLGRATRNVESAKDRLEECEQNLREIQALKEPK
ncbi:hypothetical protein LCGC14_0376060 [marine sediment metagenome]|uniref:Uncharacterized protein n=1 Tax=marine sediment metagenome TaxID=412755 RepID=A0A0F9WCI4_9ZZZZ